ncbi:hypothetical protein VP01_89g3 [Puccinia sorghi]|uniref:Uncharacterized protein n=1 Tax=Puccinia sorghi TaxID=27349 RepID=A0A0L6U7V9_9BASI|nr:hypothetical protein VP01_89g3 [Puccinia sorghi]
MSFLPLNLPNLALSEAHFLPFSALFKRFSSFLASVRSIASASHIDLGPLFRAIHLNGYLFAGFGIQLDGPGNLNIFGRISRGSGFLTPPHVNRAMLRSCSVKWTAYFNRFNFTLSATTIRQPSWQEHFSKMAVKLIIRIEASSSHIAALKNLLALFREHFPPEPHVIRKHQAWGEDKTSLSYHDRLASLHKPPVLLTCVTRAAPAPDIHCLSCIRYHGTYFNVYIEDKKFGRFYVEVGRTRRPITAGLVSPDSRLLMLLSSILLAGCFFLSHKPQRSRRTSSGVGWAAKMALEVLSCIDVILLCSSTPCGSLCMCLLASPAPIPHFLRGGSEQTCTPPDKGNLTLHDICHLQIDTCCELSEAGDKHSDRFADILVLLVQCQNGIFHRRWSWLKLTHSGRDISSVGKDIGLLIPKLPCWKTRDSLLYLVTHSMRKHTSPALDTDNTPCTQDKKTPLWLVRKKSPFFGVERDMSVSSPSRVQPWLVSRIYLRHHKIYHFVNTCLSFFYANIVWLALGFIRSPSHRRMFGCSFVQCSFVSHFESIQKSMRSPLLPGINSYMSEPSYRMTDSALARTLSVHKSSSRASNNTSLFFLFYSSSLISGEAHFSNDKALRNPYPTSLFNRSIDLVSSRLSTSALALLRIIPSRAKVDKSTAKAFVALLCGKSYANLSDFALFDSLLPHESSVHDFFPFEIPFLVLKLSQDRSDNSS